MPEIKQKQQQPAGNNKPQKVSQGGIKEQNGKGQPQKNQKSANLPEVDAETYKLWYEQILLFRRFEERADLLYGQQKIRGFLHLYIGQEAIVVGMLSALKQGDKVITAYRDHAHALAMGISPSAVMAELFGKVTGSSKGKGGSMHFFSAEHNFFGGHGIVGAQIPLGAGIAFAEKYRGSDNICVCFMGDGAVRQGALHETLTLAMLWKLPVIFVVENNKYGMGTAVERTTTIPDLYKIGLAYGMPSNPVDGMLPEMVKEAFLDAAEKARRGQPVFLEMKTYRYKGHSKSDPARYRSREEVDEYRAKDPLEHVHDTILEKGFADENWIHQINEKVKQEIDEAVQFAEQSEFPAPEELYKDNYRQEDYPYLRD